MNKLSKKKLRFWYWGLLIISYIGLFTPILVVVIMNWDKYFVQKSGWSIAMGGVYAVLLIILLLKFGSNKFNKIFWSTSMLIVVYCLNSIIQDALLLTFVFWIGTIWFFLFEFPTNFFKKRLDLYNETEIRMFAREQYELQSEKEKEKQEAKLAEKLKSSRC